MEGQDYFVLVKDLRLLEAPHELENEADLEVRPTAASSDGGGKSDGDDKHGSGPAKRKRRRPSASLGPRQPEAPPVKQTICSFWMDDKCRRGLFCAFAHGADELGSKIPPLPKGVKFREGCKAFHTIGMPCLAGKGCPWLHDQGARSGKMR